MSRTILVLGCVAAFSAAAPGVAGASTYCVGTSGADCNGGTYPATGDALQSALDAADQFADLDNTPDAVRIGPGTYLRSGGAGFHTIDDRLTIEGAGQSTVLTTDAAANRTVLSVSQTPPGGATAASVRNLRLELAGLANGLRDFRVVSDVRISGPGTAEIGLTLPPGGRVTRTTIDPAKIRTEVIVMTSGVMEDVVIRLRRTFDHQFTYGILVANRDAPTTDATLRHVTIVGDGAAGAAGVVDSAVGSSGGPRTTNVSLRDSVIRDVDYPIRRIAGTGGTANTGTANIEYRYSALDLTPSESFSSGPGATTVGPGNLNNPDPLLAADLSPTAGPPLIDFGDPGGPETGDSPNDVAGNARIFGARRDIGAFEAPAFPAGAGGGGGGAGGPGAGAIVARATSLRIAPRAFRAAASGPSARAALVRRTPPGATISYTLNRDASVRFTVRQSRPGRRQGTGARARCVPQTPRNLTARRCRRIVTLRGAFVMASKAGPNRIRFSGRLRARRLAPGYYTLVATPRADATNGRLVGIPFRILAGAPVRIRT